MSTLKERLEQCGKLAPLARRAQIDRQTLYKAFEREKATGNHTIDLATAKALAKATGRHLLWIVYGEEPTDYRGPDTLKLAKEAANLLEEGLKIPPDLAWGTMREITPVEVTLPGLFAEAVARLGLVHMLAQSPAALRVAEQVATKREPKSASEIPGAARPKRH